MDALRLLTAPIRWPLRLLFGWLPADARGQLYFEWLSFVGRLRTGPLRLDPRARNYVNLGAGTDRFEGVIGLDFFDVKPAYGADLRYPLRIADATVDGIFTEHTLEHLTYDQDARLLAECRRILKPGGRIRIILPDVSLWADAYARRDAAWFREWERIQLGPRGRRMISPMTALSFVTQEYGHRSAWDFETLERFLADAGFGEIRRRGFREGDDPRLLNDNDSASRVQLSLYVEAVKPVASLASSPAAAAAVPARALSAAPSPAPPA